MFSPTHWLTRTNITLLKKLGCYSSSPKTSDFMNLGVKGTYFDLEMDMNFFDFPLNSDILKLKLKN